MERNAKNISVKASVCKGCLEVSDDGESFNLMEMLKESIFVRRIKDICHYEIRTRTILGLYSERLCNDGLIQKVGADRIYRNIFMIKDFYNNQSLKSKIALEGLGIFENILKAVIMENCDIDWKYECEESKSNWSIKMKSKIARGLALFKRKHQFIFEKTDIGFMARCEHNFGPPIILIKGFPSFDEPEFVGPQRNVFYINRNDAVGDIKTTKNECFKMNLPKKIFKYHRKPLKEARGNCCFKGFRETLDFLKATDDENIPGQSRDFIKDLKVIGQFDKKAILAKRKGLEGGEEIWMFDQHACAERINLEKLMRSELQMTRDEMNMKACRSAVKFGDLLTNSEQEEIIKNLEKCNEPFHCAHGRPTCWLLAKLK